MPAAGATVAGDCAPGVGRSRGQPPLHVGLSFGGAVLLDLAIVRPEAIRAAALVVPGSLHPGEAGGQPLRVPCNVHRLWMPCCAI